MATDEINIDGLEYKGNGPPERGYMAAQAGMLLLNYARENGHLISMQDITCWSLGARAMYDVMTQLGYEKRDD